MKYCNNCQQNVEPKKGFSWVGFIFGLGFFYLLYYMMKSSRCPMCNSTNWGKEPKITPVKSGDARFCKFCGKQIKKEVEFCTFCGKAQR
ncbi:MAG: hypothetical protein NWE86_00910 [Candidatus Bathyarchaeota archaeon]|nr:hypothetical protein [Candidatus Bathyarchaeota archaeon]